MLFKKRKEENDRNGVMEGDGDETAVPSGKKEAEALRQLTDHLEEINGDHPDLCRQLAEGNPAANAVNSHLGKLEARFRHLLEDMIRIIAEEKELSITVGRLNSEAKSQQKSSAEILREASSFSESLESLLRHTAETADTAEEAVQTADAGNGGLNFLLDHLESIGTNMDRTWHDMEKLNSASSSINELTAVISDTAERLHLISVNTAIEASKSSNKSFQIIAREIQKMAGETSETVTRVDIMIQNILERIREVETALLSSKDSTEICLERSESVREAFSEINRTNARLKKDTEKIRDELARGNESVGVLFDTSKRISASAQGISAEADRAETLSENLVDVVNSVITEIGSYRLKWHEKLRDYGTEGAAGFRKLEDFSRKSLDLFLEDFLKSRPGFELGYILDGKGFQISSNVRLSEKGVLTREEGYRADRSGKAYFIRAFREHKAFLTDIYLSSATEELCVTAAIPVSMGPETFVIAVDANLKGLIRAA